MARIRATHRAERSVVIVTGRLTGSDTGRLEHACSPALTVPSVSLEIDVRGVTHTDESAAAWLQRMIRRGAIVITRGADSPLADSPRGG